jgi:hypothetical protein
VAVMFEARHGGAITGHVAVAGELATHGATQDGVVGEEAGVVYARDEFLLVSWTLVSVVCFLWNVKSAPSYAARARRAPCLVVCERGVCVCVCVCLVLYVCVCFKVGVSVGYGTMGSPKVCGMRVYGQV